MSLQFQVAARMRELRSETGLSQEKFALLIGMDRTYYSSIEVGRRNITLNSLSKICNGFNITLSEFFEGITI